MSTIPARAAGAIALAGRPTARIGYGMGALTGAVSAGRLTGDAAVSLLRHAREEGAQFFDTAEFYGQGLANQLLARAFGSHRDEVVFTTEVGARPVPGVVPMTAAQRPDELRQAVEANLRPLGTDRLDLVGSSAEDGHAARSGYHRSAAAGGPGRPTRRAGGSSRIGDDRRHRPQPRVPGTAGAGASRGHLSGVEHLQPARPHPRTAPPPRRDGRHGLGPYFPLGAEAGPGCSPTARSRWSSPAPPASTISTRTSPQRPCDCRRRCSPGPMPRSLGHESPPSMQLATRPAPNTSGRLTIV